MTSIIVHGGAGILRWPARSRDGVRRAADAGWDILREGRSALDAVEAAVVVMEDDPAFNCGTGSALNLSGQAEMDAAIVSDDLQFGAVGAIRDVRNPIRIARKVMEETDHVLIAGEGSIEFARKMGFPVYDPITEARRKQREKRLRAMREKGKAPRYFPKMPGLMEGYSSDTVGAVALDSGGRIAVASSTGGIILRLPGRVGDTPIIGAGSYANRFGGASASGHGEAITRLCLAKLTVDLMKRFTAQRAVDEALAIALQHKANCGLIAIDRKGRVGSGYNTKGMSCAYVVKGELVVTI